MNQKELTKAFMMISNLKNPLDSKVFIETCWDRINWRVCYGREIETPVITKKTQEIKSRKQFILVITSKQGRCTILVECWSIVVDDGQTLNQYWFYASCNEMTSFWFVAIWLQ